MSYLTPVATKTKMLALYGSGDGVPRPLGGTRAAATPSEEDMRKIKWKDDLDILDERLLAYGIVLGRAPGPAFTHHPQPAEAVARQELRRGQDAHAYRTPVTDMDLDKG